MKKLTPVLSILLVALFSFNSYGQLSKQEKKEWKKKAKEYAKNPESLKTLIEESEALQGQVSSLRAESTQLKSRMNDKDAKVSELQDDLAKLRSDLSTARKQLRDAKAAPSTPSAPSSGPMIDGVVFKVQIGAFRNKDLSKYFENNENFGGEDSGDLQKITLGQFRDYWEADTFKKYLREMGVKDAWIVPYKDGTRVPIKDVLEGVTAEETVDSE
ncbi:Ezrin/radixin/moesin family protein [Fulvivirga sp. M361]|uniref:Ezrin/radixin/moesin family protein n=1 Tax=Fulvivirga sp. M361 TaxID=2594266 RepID=UPI00117BDB7F|nr:Ezrin/radixin/moesin family protein [Fulvivirga sp. M361]TRX62675.1 Ezrin/radixin/moesin family protein [Fulvivirga sp. M361]